jgi:hypothetical protein
MSEQHSKFVSRLRESTSAVFVVAQWLHAKGKTVELPHLRVAPTAAEADSYVDSGDIVLVERKRVEVKHLGVAFDSAETWPFREVFVSNKAAVDRSFHEVAAWISVSSDLQALAIVTAGTREHWYLKNVHAKNTGNVEQFYVCPLDRVEFRKISP